jgi:hypothetical protein
MISSIADDGTSVPEEFFGAKLLGGLTPAARAASELAEG